MIKGINGFQGFLARKIENPGNSATTYSFENMTQYIRPVLYGQHQLASTNGINATEDLFNFSKVEGNASNEAKTMIGDNGIKLDGSQKIWQNRKTERIDVENFAPGKLPGNIHYHEPNNTKWYLDISEKIFYDKKRITAPKKYRSY